MPSDPRDDPPFEDERPTSPDLASLPCPTCRDEAGRPTGEVLRGLEPTRFGHRSVRGRCPTCFGQLKVDRVTFERARAEAKRDD
jgi:hypothetical protein